MLTSFSNIFQPDVIGFDSNGVLYAANRQCGGGGLAQIDGTNSATPGAVTCLATVPTIDGLAVSPKPGSPIIFGNRNDGIITRVDLSASQPPVVTDTANVVTGGTRGDFATVGPDGCLYATQTDRVIRVANSAGKCPYGGFHNASENLSSCLAPCSSNPQVDPVNGNVYTTWLNNTSGNANVLFNASHNNGSSFGPVIKITNSTSASAANQQIASVGNDVYIVWQQNVSLTSNNILFRASTNNGTSFGPIITIISSGASCGGGCTISNSIAPQVASVGSNVYVTWLAMTNKGVKILFKASTTNGSNLATVTALTLSSTAYGLAQPQIAALTTFVYATWSDLGTVGRPQTFFAASSNSGTSFGTTFSLAATPVGETDLNPKMAVAGNSVYVTWTNHTSTSDNTMFAASNNNGTSFAAALNLNNAVVTDLNPELAAFGTNVYIVWSEANGGNTEVLYRGSFNNGASFGSLLNLSNVPGTSNEQMIAASGINVYVTWIESGTSSNGVYFALSSDGGSTFGTLFNLIRDSVSSNPVVADPGGYADVAWEDRSTGNGDIYLVSGIPFAFDFSIANSGTISLMQGNSGSNSINLAFISGTSQNITLSCSGGSPSGASCTFNPVSGTPSFSSVLVISTQPSTPTGSYIITVTGTAGDLGFGETRSTQVTLMVSPGGTIGGVTLSADRLALLAFLIIPASLIIGATTAGAFYFRRAKHKQKSQ